jgi:hypothetical protein
MEAKDYTIQGGSEEISVYNLKLTEEIVAKLQKGQKNLEDLVGVEFVLSNSDKEINVHLVMPSMTNFCFVET